MKLLPNLKQPEGPLNGIVFEFLRLSENEGYHAFDPDAKDEPEKLPEIKLEGKKVWASFVTAYYNEESNVLVLLEKGPGPRKPTIGQLAKYFNNWTPEYDISFGFVPDAVTLKDYLRNDPIHEFSYNFGKLNDMSSHDPGLGHEIHTKLLELYGGVKVQIKVFSGGGNETLNRDFIERMAEGVLHHRRRSRIVREGFTGKQVRVRSEETHRLRKALDLAGARKVHVDKRESDIEASELQVELRAAVRRAWEENRDDLIRTYRDSQPTK